MCSHLPVILILPYEYGSRRLFILNHLSPHVFAYGERFNFYNARQMKGENIKSWYARCKSLSVNRRFNNNLEFALKDKFVTGLLKGRILEALLEESIDK